MTKSIRALCTIGLGLAVHAVAQNAQAQSDEFGHVADTIPLAYEDASGGGQVFLGDDQVSGAVPIGFTFFFYGVPYTELYISSNGFITFLAGQSNGCCTGIPSPSPDSPNGVIAAYWADHFPPGGGSIEYKTAGDAPNRRFIVAWRNLPEYGNGGNRSEFEIILHEDGDHWSMHFVRAEPGNHSWATGWEDSNGVDGANIRSGRYSLSGSAIEVTSNPDIDSDGILNRDDNCRRVANAGQEDADADGFGDACDFCPLVPGNDPDGDGICVDNCPNTANPGQEDGDGDGAGDVCDNCVSTANIDQADDDSDGAGNACDACPADASNDGDGDGLCGNVDNCPDTSNADQADGDLDGAGDACDNCALTANVDQEDSDGDGLGNLCDNCPLSYNPDQSDSDGDGVADACDNCSSAPNPDQADSDEDTVGNICDNCPNDPNGDNGGYGGYGGFQSDGDGDGVGDACDVCPNVSNPDQSTTDDDADGVPNACDNCPGLQNSDQYDDDGDGFGNACDVCPSNPNAQNEPGDIDGDGIPDACDNCPDAPNPDQLDVNHNGQGDACEPQAAILLLDGCFDNILFPFQESGFVGLNFPLNFYGLQADSGFINTNGNFSLYNPIQDLQPFNLATYTGNPVIAPFFADVDTSTWQGGGGGGEEVAAARAAFAAAAADNPLGSDVITYGYAMYDGMPAFCVNWDGRGVGYANGHADKLNRFQMVLVSRSQDLGDPAVPNGDFDIIFNFDGITWDTADTGGGVEGIGDEATDAIARMGYSNGTGAAGTSYEYAFSGGVGALLDGAPSALATNAESSCTSGRYIFPIRNGPQPTGSIGGRVYRSDGTTGAAGAPFQIQRPDGTVIYTGKTNANGDYLARFIPDSGVDGPYKVTAFPPAGATQESKAADFVPVEAGGPAVLNLTLDGPRPVPPEVTLEPTRSPGNPIPIVYWMDDLHLTYDGCAGGTARYVIDPEDGANIPGPMPETSPGHYEATIPAVFPAHGNTRIDITVDCVEPEPDEDSGFNIYIDPSGFVTDQNGAPVVGATVTLFRSDNATGPFVQVPNGDPIMSPANRVNPDRTDATGHYGWDTVVGYYLVRASAPNCNVVESRVVVIPPAVLDLNIQLTCNQPTGPCAGRADGTVCEDGNACTQNDTCQAGACVGGAARTCAASDACHEAGTCDPATGQCSNPEAADGTSCDDGNACTQTDSCVAGACQGASPVTCEASDACHVAGSCDPATGACTSPAAADGTSCDDGNACTQTDTCQAGACSGSNAVTCAANDVCHVAGVCDPATGVCSNPPAADGTSCNDGNACTQSDTCQAGTCTGASPVTCTASDSCHVAGVCDPATGACSNPTASNGTSCDDGNPCTQASSCQAGTCTGSNPVTCTASDSCHVAGVCDPATGACTNPPAADGTTCNDGNACTQSDSCQAGACTGSNPVTCTASDQCHAAGVCNPATGLCSNPPAVDGTSCNDGNGCTQSDTCQAGRCFGGAPVVCTASDQCHNAGTCNPSTGQCSNPEKANGTTCNDQNACTRADSCQAGVCTGRNPVTCTASDQCHDAGTCDPRNGQCSNPAKPNGASCNDGNACTRTDTCQAGACTGARPVECPAGDECHAASTCNPSNGQCSSRPNLPDGTQCDDGNACTQTDRCRAGSCRGSNRVQCTASDQCHEAGECNPSTGACSNPAKPNGTRCDDDNECTRRDQCNAGVCSGRDPVQCNDERQHGRSCRRECVPQTGRCRVVHTNQCHPDDDDDDDHHGRCDHDDDGHGHRHGDDDDDDRGRGRDDDDRGRGNGR